MFSRFETKLFKVFVTVFSVLSIWRFMDVCLDKISFQNHLYLCIVLTILTELIWFGWCINHFQHKQLSKSVSVCLICHTLFVIAASFEMIDSPPLDGILDAHAFWHLLTIPIFFIWFRFWQLDEDITPIEFLQE